ncbi:hypothetical protein SEA_EVY_127 [Streptomyces phage Evy]|uniref:Uncharacterized protein n=1 Tax=Streptomyces phage Evy TaxID=2588514 RepID=A0A514DK52_9CAUD|nr:hypothetical protein KNU67_gp145 [Streptomyces phage Evy]QDH93987.1 hypothetical protein SEA_EVY_127 [Streptomyces phage Evy]UEM46908.1 hypothetical protein SEA_TARGARYEN_130 [Streptomyces phage Targaryen]
MTDKLFGRNVNGEPQTEDGWPDQDDPQLLIDALDKVLALENVAAVRWDQYTPSFNDGEPCRFSVHTVEVRLEGFEVSEDGFETGEGRWYDEGDEVYLGSYDLYTYGERPDGSVDYDKKVYEVQGIPTKEIKEALDAFETLLDNKAHYAWLLANFGDPATVTANETDFDVEFCEHE